MAFNTVATIAPVESVKLYKPFPATFSSPYCKDNKAYVDEQIADYISSYVKCQYEGCIYCDAQVNRDNYIALACIEHCEHCNDSDDNYYVAQEHFGFKYDYNKSKTSYIGPFIFMRAMNPPNILKEAYELRKQYEASALTNPNEPVKDFDERLNQLCIEARGCHISKYIFQVRYPGKISLRLCKKLGYLY